MPVIHFKGKTAVESYHHIVPHHTLDFNSKLSLLPKAQDPSLDGNLIIEGDNLVALKALLPTHAGQIQCVYFDPPYNTGNEDWVYNDNLTQPQFKEWIGNRVGKEGEDYTRHDKWCCMMYPRLKLLKELLDPELGVILISIDDNEFHHLRMLLDEVFGFNNLVATLLWEKGRKNDAKFVSVGHEYLLIYAASLEGLKRRGVWREAKPGAKEIQDEYERLRAIHGKDNEAVQEALREFYRALPKGHPAKKHSRYGNVDNRGVWRDDNMSWPGGGGPTYDVPHPKTKKPCKVPDGGWRYATLEKMNEMIAAGVVQFRADHTEPPIRKTYLVRSVSPDIESDGEDEDDVGIQVAGSYFYRSALQASNQLFQIFGKKVFENPKDHEVLMRWIRYVTFGDRNAVILDPTAGSGPTGHAVLQLNREDGGKRRFVLVQQPYDTNKHKEDKLNICEKITAERIRRVITGYSNQKSRGQKAAGLGGSFSYCRVGKALFGEYRDLGKTVPSYEELAKYIFYTETSRHFDKKASNTKTGKIGEKGKTSYYLLYTPNNKEDRQLDLNWLKSVEKADANKSLVVYCEKIWIHRDDLAKHERETGRKVRPMIIPFNLK
jgi:adenine-specific DNA-methyltransferase